MNINQSYKIIKNLKMILFSIVPYFWKFPKYIQIQTTSYCNGGCIFCPYNFVKDKITQGIMPWGLYKKLIDEISRSNVKRIIPYLMNEPLLDKQIIKKINYAKEKNPRAIIELSTNGSLLFPKIAKRLLNSKLDELRIGLPAFSKKRYNQLVPGLNFEIVIKNLKNFLRLAKDIKNNIKVLIWFVKIKDENEDELIKIKNFVRVYGVDLHVAEYSDRAGNNKFCNFGIKKLKLVGCKVNRDKEWFHILFNGDVVLCCMDYKHELILGNVNISSIVDTWNGKAYRVIRKKISGLVESEPNFICKRCNNAI